MRCLHRVEAAFLLTLGLVGCQGVLERDDGLSDAPIGPVAAFKFSRLTDVKWCHPKLRGR